MSKIRAASMAITCALSAAIQFCPPGQADGWSGNANAPHPGPNAPPGGFSGPHPGPSMAPGSYQVQRPGPSMAPGGYSGSNSTVPSTSGSTSFSSQMAPPPSGFTPATPPGGGYRPPNPTYNTPNNVYQNQQQYQTLMGNVPHAGPPTPMPDRSGIPKSQDAIAIERWTNEWKQQHPGQPVPSVGVLEHLHSAEINDQVRKRGQEMWAKRQADLKQEYQMARQMQQQKNNAGHVVWNSSQWAQWDRDYSAAHKAQAEAFLKAWGESGEYARHEARREMGWEP